MRHIRSEPPRQRTLRVPNILCPLPCRASSPPASECPPSSFYLCLHLGKPTRCPLLHRPVSGCAAQLVMCAAQVRGVAVRQAHLWIRAATQKSWAAAPRHEEPPGVPASFHPLPPWPSAADLVGPPPAGSAVHHCRKGPPCPAAEQLCQPVRRRCGTYSTPSTRLQPQFLAGTVLPPLPFWASTHCFYKLLFSIRAKVAAETLQDALNIVSSCVKLCTPP